MKEKLEEVRSLLQSSTKTESSIPLLPSSKESNKRKSNIKCNLLTVRKKRKTEKNRVGVAKEKKNSASAIDVLCFLEIPVLRSALSLYYRRINLDNMPVNDRPTHFCK